MYQYKHGTASEERTSARNNKIPNMFLVTGRANSKAFIIYDNGIGNDSQLLPYMAKVSASSAMQINGLWMEQFLFDHAKFHNNMLLKFNLTWNCFCQSQKYNRTRNICSAICWIDTRPLWCSLCFQCLCLNYCVRTNTNTQSKMKNALIISEKGGIMDSEGNKTAELSTRHCGTPLTACNNMLQTFQPKLSSHCVAGHFQNTNIWTWRPTRIT